MGKNTFSRVLLMRSGRTEWDLLGRVQGAADLPMAAAGLEAVRKQLQPLAGQKLVSIATAPDEASQATAKLLAAATGVKRVTVVPELGEMALGLWEGLRYEELENRYCSAGRQFMDDPSGVVAPEGEQMEDYEARVHGALAKVVSRHRAGSSVGIVVRPLALGLLRCFLNGADICQLWAMLKDRPDAEWYQVPKDDPRLIQTPRRPRRSASAA
jgi:broad specificity phosphatase PhoE